MRFALRRCGVLVWGVSLSLALDLSVELGLEWYWGAAGLGSGLSLTAHAEEVEPPAHRVLHISSSTAETTLDPVGIQDLYSAKLASVLFEGALTYDYLASPAKLIPLLAEGMPEISDGGKTWTIHLKKNVRIQGQRTHRSSFRYGVYLVSIAGSCFAFTV